MPFTKPEINDIYSIVKQINKDIIESLQLHDESKPLRLNVIYKREEFTKISMLWFYIDKLNEYKLKILLKRHKEIEAEFFLRFNPKTNLYVVGWKK